MEIEYLKENWESSNAALERGSQSRKNIDPRQKTTLQRLASRYRRMAIVSAVSLCWVMPLYFRLSEENPDTPLFYPLVMVAFFLITAGMDYWLCRGIQSIDCATMSVETVLKKVYFYRKRHIQFIFILMPIALLIIYLMLAMFNFEKYALLGAACGFMVGLAFGLKILFDFMRDYKQVLN